MAGTANIVPAEIVAVYDAVRPVTWSARQPGPGSTRCSTPLLSVNFIAAVKAAPSASRLPGRLDPGAATSASPTSRRVPRSRVLRHGPCPHHHHSSHFLEMT